MSQAPRRPEIRALTALRWLAAVGVVVYHYGGEALNGAPAPVVTLFGNSFVVLTFFFLLSGFVLGQGYLDEAGLMNASPRRYLRARLARIFPVYAATWLLSAPFAVKGLAPADAALQGVLSLAMVQAWFPRYALAWNSPAWSMAAELFFYAGFPLLAPRLARVRGGAVYAAIGLCWLAALAAPAAYLAGAPIPLDLVKYQPILHLPSFAAGVLFSRVARAQAGRIARLPALAIDAFLLACAALLFVDYGAAGLLVHNGAFLPLIGLMMLVLHRDTWVTKALSIGPLHFLGSASYAFYLLQHPLVCAWSHFFGQRFFAGYLALLTLASLVLYRGFEEPLRRALQKGMIETRAICSNIQPIANTHVATEPPKRNTVR